MTLFLPAMFPAPLLEALVYPFYAYIQAEAGYAADVSATVGRILAEDRWEIIAVWALSTAAAILCYRHHARYADRSALAWALFVLLMGVPGAIGYWLHRTWPVTERCTNCGAIVPRDHDNCLACAEQFAPPARTGIEVFA